jgi:hypothetical protein
LPARFWGSWRSTMMVGELVSFQAEVLALHENGDVTVCLPSGDHATFKAKELTVNTAAAPAQSEEPVQCSAGDEAEDAAVAAGVADAVVGATFAPPPAETAEDEAEAEVEAEAEAEAAPAWPAAAPAPTAPGPEGMLFQAIEMVDPNAVPPPQSSSDNEEAEAKAEVEAKVEEEEEEAWCSAPGLLALLGAGSFVALPPGQSEEAEAAEEEEEDEAQ